MKMKINLVEISWMSLLLFMSGNTAAAYESAFEPTPVGTMEVITLPPAITMEAGTEGPYFEKANDLFRQLFRYLKKHEVTMTAPVQGDVSKTKMRFFLGSKDAKRGLDDDGSVTLIELPRRTVATVGARGSYSEKNFHKARARLETWIKKQAEYHIAGDAYGVYWDSPFTLWFLKRFDVHIPVRPRSEIEK